MNRQSSDPTGFGIVVAWAYRGFPSLLLVAGRRSVTNSKKLFDQKIARHKHLDLILKVPLKMTKMSRLGVGQPGWVGSPRGRAIPSSPLAHRGSTAHTAGMRTLGSCQDWGLFWGPSYNAAPNVSGTPPPKQRTITLTNHPP